MSVTSADAARWLGPAAQTREQITGAICAPMLTRLSWRNWWIAFAAATALTALMWISAIWVLVDGIGVWGVNSVIVWGFAIANYVWWIGIGNAGTLISALLLITRQHWRASLNRFAETMTLFAASIAGLFPILHLGRPYLLYWIIPYPNRMGLWPQWRSALVWDFWAVSVYILFSLLFWYAGLIPDLAILRDRARNPTTRRIYGAFALGWRGSAVHWDVHQRMYRAMAAIAVPMVCMLHSIVALDFAASLMPGWQETIFPPYFVVGALYSGFGVVAIIAACIRWGFGLESLVTRNHFEVIARVLLAAATVMGISYAVEWFTAWYSDDRAGLNQVIYEFTGTYWPMYMCQLLFNVVVPQLFWSPRVRNSIAAVFTISVIINVGMWIERILIVWNTLGRGHMPSTWRIFIPTFWDWSLLLGSLGFFLFLYLIFSRVLPVISMHEVLKLLHEERRG
jgi:molybdopterin-containing oxidoreductase family membrane subunit